jgi:hypothetical protein
LARRCGLVGLFIACAMSIPILIRTIDLQSGRPL